ncbi:MAG: TetR/AcrR family transcriptional regulator [Bacillota bacterium]
MARITKEPEERRAEIIDAAMELFITKGFEETAIGDIVAKVGVAQGLFYYYFKSKYEILDEVVGRIADQYLGDLFDITNNQQLGVIKKIQVIFRQMFKLMAENEKLILYVHRAENELLHYRLQHKFAAQAVDLFLNIIEQGVREGIFEVEYPRETAEILMAGIGNMPSIFDEARSLEQFYYKLQAGLAVIEKALGAPKGSLHFEFLPGNQT